MPAPTIFISYRRDDSAGYARAVYDELARRFGAERVFMDVDDIHAGHAFAETIGRALDDAVLALVLIGPRWLGERPGQPARIGEAGDFVRLEVGAVLSAGVRVIPLLLDGTPMPAPANLPEELRPLVGRNALELDNSRFAADMERLVAAVRETIGSVAVAPPPPRRLVQRWATPVMAAVLGGLLLAWWLHGRGVSVPTSTPASSAPAPGPVLMAPAPGPVRAAIDGEWQAELVYDWPNARYTERFVFAGEGASLQGSASFLGVPRGLLDGRLEEGGLSFVTRTRETGHPTEVVHRYRARLAGTELRFTMQTEGASTPHVPVEFIARRVAARP